MNEEELERAISKLKAKLIMEGEDSVANGEIKRKLVHLQTQRIKLKEIEEVIKQFAYNELAHVVNALCPGASPELPGDQWTQICSSASSEGGCDM